MLIKLIILVAIDIATKMHVVSNYELYESTVISNWLSITYVHNYGAAFSIMSDWADGSLILLMASILGVLGLGWWHAKTEDGLEKIGIFLMLSGTIGNLIDRWQFGYVVDFIDVHYGTLYWPVFNIADICISIGLIFIIKSMLRNESDKG